MALPRMSHSLKLLSLPLVAVVSSMGVLACTKTKREERIVVVPAEGGPALNNVLTLLQDASKAPEAVRNAGRAVVRLPSGTGSFVTHKGRTFLMTNHHVIGKNECAKEGCFVPVRLNYGLGEKSITKVLLLTPFAADADQDVSFFSFESDEGPEKETILSTFTPTATLTLTSKKASDLVGRPIHIVGHPHTALKKWSSGSILKTKNGYVASTGFAMPGSSGSPVLDANGGLVAIHHSGNSDVGSLTTTSVQRISYHTPSASLSEVLERGFQASARALPGFRSFADASHDPYDPVTAQLMVKARWKPSVLQSVYFEKLRSTCDSVLAKQASSPANDSQTWQSDMAPCAVAFNWLRCNDGEKSASSCFSTDTASVWANISEKLSKETERYPGTSGTMNRFWETEGLYSGEEGCRRAHDGLLRELEAKKAPLTLNIAFNALSCPTKDIATRKYRGATLRSFVLDAPQKPNWLLTSQDYVIALASARSSGVLNQAELAKAYSTLATNAELSLKTRLTLERYAYGWNVTLP